MQNTPRIAVLGAGGIGGFLAARLAHVGADVTCIVREHAVDRLRGSGITVNSDMFGTFTAAVTVEPELRHPVDACIVAVKSQHLGDAMDRLNPDALVQKPLVSLLNGVEHVSTIVQRFPEAMNITGAIKIESTRVAPAEIEHTSKFAAIDLGLDGYTSAQIAPVVTPLSDAGITVQEFPAGAQILWQKLSFLAPFALLTTRYESTIGAVLTSWPAALDAATSEVVRVAQAAAHVGDEATCMEMYRSFPYDAKSSMLRDFEVRNELELDAIGGAVIREAERQNIPVPVVTELVNHIKAMTATE